MQTINLLEPLSEKTRPRRFTRFPTIAEITSVSRTEDSPLDFEVSMGGQQFEVPKRSNLNTDWYVEWQGQYFKIIGILPCQNITKMILYTRLVQLNLEIVARSFILSLGENVLALGKNQLALEETL